MLGPGVANRPLPGPARAREPSAVTIRGLIFVACCFGVLFLYLAVGGVEPLDPQVRCERRGRSLAPCGSFLTPPAQPGKLHVLVTGGAGYIGSHAAMRLLLDGAQRVRASFSSASRRLRTSSQSRLHSSCFSRLLNASCFSRRLQATL